MLSGNANQSSLSNLVLFGAFLGLVGSLLDFYSGYQILTQSAMTTYTMGMAEIHYGYSGLVWGIGILALGALLLVTTLASSTSFGMHRMKPFGAMMASYGIVMLFVGLSMYFGVTPMMAGTTLSGLGMLAVGTLMVLNGAMMWRLRTLT